MMDRNEVLLHRRRVLVMGLGFVSTLSDGAEEVRDDFLMSLQVVAADWGMLEELEELSRSVGDVVFG